MDRSRHASFSTEQAPRDPVTFDIDDEEFVCHPHIPGDALLYYAHKMMPDQSGRTVLSRDDLWEFFGEVMPDDERERFEKFVHDPDRFVNVELLAQIMAHLIGEYQGKAAKRPRTRRSSAGASQTSGGSEES